MEDMLIWVDESDKEIGSGPKLYTHEIAQLHRAFSVFIFDLERKNMLLQRRAQSKYHSGGLWTNACCSHPRVGETLEEAIRKRFAFELGVELDEKIEKTMTHCGSFVYKAGLGALTEHELDHVYTCIVDRNEFRTDCFNPDEIDALQWFSIDELEKQLEEHPEEFTAWFPLAFDIVKLGM